jgi:hypothetical protein
VSDFEEQAFEDMINSQRIGERSIPSLNKYDRAIECMTVDELDEFIVMEENKDDMIASTPTIEWSEEGNLDESNSINGDDCSDMDESITGESNASSEYFLDETKQIRYDGSNKVNLDLKIIEWFEKKKCPFFVASDGGNLNEQEHGINRGASAVALGAPLMNEDEDFLSIIDEWMDREPIIFIVRTSILPVRIGDNSVSNVQTEASGFCNLATMLYKNPPQISILDSNATVFSARKIRDEFHTAVRRQMRGPGVAAGNSYSGRMRRLFQDWNGEQHKSIRGEKNQGQWKSLKTAYQQMGKWVEDEEIQWRREYLDENERQPIVLVDSHQYDDHGRFVSKKYKKPSPCRFFVKMNEVADKMVMMALHEKFNNPMSKVSTPEDINYPPGGFRFNITIDGNTVDGDTPLAIRKRGHQTFLNRAMKKEKQGHLLRIAEKTNLTPKIVGMRGSLSRVLRHLATSHSQSYYRNKSYQRLHQTYGKVKKVEGKEAQREEDLICPFAAHNKIPMDSRVTSTTCTCTAVIRHYLRSEIAYMDVWIGN